MLFVVCVYVGHKLAVAAGPWLANAIGVEYESGQRTMFGLFFTAVVAIVGVIAYRVIGFVLWRRHLGAQDWTSRRPNIRKLARLQRWLLGLVLAFVALWVATMAASNPRGPLTGLGTMPVFPLLKVMKVIVTGLSLVIVVLVLRTDGSHPAVVLFGAIMMLIPLVNFLTLVLVNSSTTRILRRAGLPVGLTGVRADVVERILRGDLCTKCGYNLSGNVSGRCPECGKAT